MTLRPVYASEYAAMLAGAWDYLCAGVPTDARGFYVSAWQAAPASGDLYVGIVAEPASAISGDAPAIGLAEVQIRGGT